MTNGEAVSLLMSNQYYERGYKRGYKQGYKQGVSDVLDKIRAEIEKWHKEGTNWSDIRLMKIEDILDKYRTKSEE